MSEFHDPDLRQELGRLSGPYPDDNAAFAAWQRRVGQVRRRRVVAWTTAAALSLVVGTVGVAALQSPGRHTLVPSKAGESSTEVRVSIATTEKAAPTTESTEPEKSEVTTLAPDTTPSSETVETSTPETSTPEAVEEPAGGSSKGHGPTSQPPGGSQSNTHQFSSIGGIITVRQNGDQLTVVSMNAAAGFHGEQDEHSGSRVEVTFKSDNHESQITVRLENGVLKPHVSEKPDEHNNNGNDNTVPDSSGGDHGGGGKNG
jgi:hypothetical protein